MKSAVIPQVRVEPELRHDLEAVLHNGETISGFVEAAVRNAVAFRHAQSRFHDPREGAWQRFRATGESRTPEEVLGKLQAKLDAKRKQLSEWASMFVSA